VLVAAPASGKPLAGLGTCGRVEVVGGGAAGRAIAAGLAAAGVDAHAVEAASEGAAGIVFAGGLQAVGAEGATAVHLAALRAARAIARRQGARVFVTVQDTGGDFALSGRAGERAWVGGLTGLVKTVAAEWAGAAVKAIDVAGASPDDVAARVVAELLGGGDDVEVALGPGGTRSVVQHFRAPYAASSGRARVREGSVLVVSGGARGVTATSLAALGPARPRLALLGRTALVDEGPETASAATEADIRRALLARAQASGVVQSPKDVAREAKLILDCREIRANVAMLERSGAEVGYHAVDVRSGDAVRACVGEIRRAWGPIHGVIHGAGVLADALIASQTDEQFDRVFGTKVDGLRHLLAATANDPIELLVVFSSVAGRLGNSAQAAYAMANEVLSAVAADERARRGDACLVRSLAWGPWAGGMVTPGLAKLFEKAGVKLIALDSGAAALAREVASEDAFAQVILMNGDPPATAIPVNRAG
jgi:hypothetical protein